MDPVSRARQDVANNEKSTRRPGGITGKGFMPGRSGNPSGRPKKNHVTKMYERLLSNPQKRKEIEEAVFNRLVSNRMVGSLELRECADRTEGKVAQEVDMNVSGTLALAEVIHARRKRRGDSDNQS